MSVLTSMTASWRAGARNPSLLICLSLLTFCLMAGAADPQPAPRDWAFRALQPSKAPVVKDTAWPRSSVDCFILAELEARGLGPAPPADKVTLLRRATFDVLGLPPTPEELDAFIQDQSPGAFARVVDRLLASPHYGERWGRHWLDLARFGESDGFEYDKLRESAWPYRDYVIWSFNRDKPCAEFLKEQIAGDVMTPQTQEGIAATGFLVGGPYDEAGFSSKSDLLKARIREEHLEDMVAVVSQTFLGLTVNCARCHDHKFDPISQEDYFRFQAGLAGVWPGNRPRSAQGEILERERQARELEQRVAQLENEGRVLEARGRARIAAQPPVAVQEGQVMERPFARWTFDGDARDALGTLHGRLEGGAIIRDGRLVLNGRTAFMRTEPLPKDIREKTLEAWLCLSNLTQQGGGVVSIETPRRATFDAIVFGERQPRIWMAGSSFFQRSRDFPGPKENATPGELLHVAIAYHPDNHIAVYRNGQPYAEAYVPTGENSQLQTFPGTGKTAPDDGSHLLLGLRHTGAGNGFLAGDLEEVRFYDRALSADQIAQSFRTGPAVITTSNAVAALTHEEQAAYENLQRDLAKQRVDLAALRRAEQVYAVSPRQVGPTYVLARGDVEKRQGEIAAGGLTAIKTLSPSFALAADAPEAQRRLRLAAWMAHPDNPLPARVWVNRLWHYHFGRGLVAQPNDFGVNGGPPSHPELLDYLAGELQAHGGSIKYVQRLIMLSAVYQQASLRDLDSKLLKAAQQLDAENAYLWHFPLRRLEGEVVRDSMLSASGELNERIGGPGFRPFDVTISGSHFYHLTDPDGPEFNRRTIYRMNVQSAKEPMLEVLDCPDPSTKTPARTVTTTPIQALALMNSPFVQRRAASLATRVRREVGHEPSAQIERAYRLTLGRLPSPRELRDSLELQHAHGMASVAWVLFNASEFLYTH